MHHSSGRSSGTIKLEARGDVGVKCIDSYRSSAGAFMIHSSKSPNIVKLVAELKCGEEMSQSELRALKICCGPTS